MSNEAHEKGVEAAIRSYFDAYDGEGDFGERDAICTIIKTYLSASGLMLVPREPTNSMVIAGSMAMPDGVVFSLEPGEGIDDYDGRPVYEAMISSFPNHFESKQDE